MNWALEIRLSRVAVERPFKPYLRIREYIGPESRTRVRQLSEIALEVTPYVTSTADPDIPEILQTGARLLCSRGCPLVASILPDDADDADGRRDEQQGLEGGLEWVRVLGGVSLRQGGTQGPAPEAR